MHVRCMWRGAGICVREGPRETMIVGKVGSQKGSFDVAFTDAIRAKAYVYLQLSFGFFCFSVFVLQSFLFWRTKACSVTAQQGARKSCKSGFFSSSLEWELRIGHDVLAFLWLHPFIFSYFLFFFQVTRRQNTTMMFSVWQRFSYQRKRGKKNLVSRLTPGCEFLTVSKKQQVRLHILAVVLWTSILYRQLYFLLVLFNQYLV